MAKSLIDLVVAANRWLYTRTDGRLGSRLAGQAILLLNTVGRKTGNVHTTPLSYYRDGSAYLVVASNWGKETHPHWLLNLMEQPQATIQVGSSSLNVTARVATEKEQERLWQLVTSQNRQYLKYQEGLARRIPVVQLTPIES